MMLIRYNKNDLWDWSPFNRLSTLQDEINRVFEAPLASLTQGSRFLTGWVPALDLLEDKDSLIVRAELPGLKKEDIEISLRDGSLSVSGERKVEDKNSDAETYRSERFYGRFHRAVSLPKPVQGDKVKASYKDGILTITLPKTEESKPKRIEVSTN